MSSSALCLFAAPALAQPQDEEPEVPVQTEADPTTGEEEQAIVVTGSRIARRDLTSTSPLAVVQDEEFRLSGAVNVEQVVNTLPQIIPGTTAFSNNPGGGFATLDLRGLGPTRTLVLVNGRRWMFFDVNQAVDLNTIPSFLIDSVDVVTGGASAVYGSDALGGVVNFRLRTDVDGLIAGSQYGITEEGDGRRFNAYVAMGSQFADGRGNVTAFAEYFKRGQVLQGDRDFSFFALGEGDGELVPGGSSTPPFPRLTDFLDNTGGAFPNTGFVIPVAGAPGRNALPGLGDFYNYAPANFLQVPQERWLVGGYADYEITEGVEAFTEVTFTNNRVDNELAATPVTGFFNIDVAQACQFLTAQDCARFQQAGAAGGDPDVIENLFVQRRVIESGSRASLDERNAFRALVGLRGDITDDLSYETYYFYARTRNSNVQEGNISRSAFQAGLDGTGTPINIFGPGTLTPEMVDAITIRAQNNDISNLQVANAALTGSLFTLPWAVDPVGFAAGLEWRSVSSRFIPDTALQSGDVVGFNAGQATAGGYDVKEAFAELRIPIVQENFIHRFELTGAARYSDYSLEAVGGVWTYAAGAELAPIRDITFRGQYQRAIRAPNVSELFGGLAVGFPPANDPCADPAAAADPTVRNLCIQTGVPANRVGDPALQLNPQIEGLFGGNPDLREEVSDTWTVGAVIQPRFIPRLNITVDYYNITIEDFVTIRGGGVNNILRLCYEVIQDVNSVYCQAINRNAGGIISGDEFVVIAPDENIARIETSGIDFQIDYSLPLAFSATGAGDSRLNFFLLGTWLDKFDFTPAAPFPDEVNECGGTFGLICADPRPTWKWTSRLSWIDGPVTTSFRWRHLGAVDDDDDTSDFVVERIGSVDYFDLAFAFDVNDNLTVNMGVNNLFDKEPPLVGDNQQQSNTWPSTYEVLGRDYFISANLRF